MIHKIKSLYNNGDGLSIRAIAEQLNISRNTVRKYLRMAETEISERQSDRSRTKQLDAYREYIVHLLENYPDLSAVKVLRKLKQKYEGLAVSDRSVRRYVEQLRKTVALKQVRYYEPVLDMVPGVQCQVDPGELRSVLINGVETVVYFVVFVLSYSRLMYAAVSAKPINTQIFIQMHDEAFRYFGGRPEECVYDQTKLVVLHEQYRELQLNQRFHEYATHAGYQIHACEGFDPESKGKVEAGVKYVKQNCLYGEQFNDWQHLQEHVKDWLDNVANTRLHGTTGQVPLELYEAEERQTMQPYLTPSVVHPSGHQLLTRQADKTGLIAWQSNKYSVPMVYQRCRVGVQAEGSQLHIFDLESGEEIACHTLSTGKGQIVRNNNHYRDRAQQVADYERTICQRLGDNYGSQLCALLRRTSPKIYKDQLVGAKQVLAPYQVLPTELLEHLCQRPRLTATGLRDYLAAYTSQPERLHQDMQERASGEDDGALSRYADLMPELTQEASYELH